MSKTTFIPYHLPKMLWWTRFSRKEIRNCEPCWCKAFDKLGQNRQGLSSTKNGVWCCRNWSAIVWSKFWCIAGCTENGPQHLININSMLACSFLYFWFVAHNMWKWPQHIINIKTMLASSFLFLICGQSWLLLSTRSQNISTTWQTFSEAIIPKSKLHYFINMIWTVDWLIGCIINYD